MGVIYIGVDNNDGWKMMLSKEMKAAGLNIDLNKQKRLTKAKFHGR